MTTQHSTAAYDAARRRAGSIDRGHLARLVVSGADRASYLNGLLTNDVAALQAGHGCYAAYLTPQGRMITDLRVYELGDTILITLPRDLKDAMLARLDQLVFTEDVSLGDVTDTFAQVAVVGPLASRAMASVLGVDAGVVSALPEHGNMRGAFDGRAAIVLRTTDTGEDGYDLLVEAPAFASLLQALEEAGVERIDPETAEVLRVEAGVPRFHADMDEETIPLEAGIESRAISFTKGCYVGQEVIVRVLHRGHGRVARRLVGLTLDGGSAPKAGAEVRADGRELGRVTSGVASEALKKPIALAYLHRDFTEPGTRVTVGGEQAVVTRLPFVPRAESR